MADWERDQQNLNNHVKACQKCLNAKSLQDCCTLGRALALIIEGKRTR